MTMGAFTSYTFVAGLVLLSLYLVYKWLLANEKQPLFNRCVLLGTYVVSALVPAFVFSGIECSRTLSAKQLPENYRCSA